MRAFGLKMQGWQVRLLFSFPSSFSLEQRRGSLSFETKKLTRLLLSVRSFVLGSGPSDLPPSDLPPRSRGVHADGTVGHQDVCEVSDLLPFS